MNRRGTTASTAPAIEKVMWRLANGEASAIIDLYEHFRWKIDGAVRRRALTRGLWLTAYDIDDITWATCLLLAQRAPGWQPGAAAPWTWAASAIDDLILRHVGPPRSRDSAESRERFEATSRPTPHPQVRGDGPALLRALALNNDLVALLDEAIRTADTKRNGEVFVEHFVQQALGDPSPADTVAQIVGLRAPAVRQIVHRCRARLRRVVANQERFAALISLPVLQPARPRLPEHEVPA